MAALTDYTGSVAVIVSSCDAFFDAWAPFAHFFRKFWPDCPFFVHLITNELHAQSAWMRPLPVGPDRDWAANMIVALDQITATHVLYFQEDYFLDGPVNAHQLADDFRYAFEHEVDAFCFRGRSEVESGFQSINDRFGLVPIDSDGRTRCQLTLWQRTSFLRALRSGENAWEMESQGSVRTRDMKIISYRTRENLPVPYLMSAIVRGLWTREALAFSARENVVISPHFRGTYTSHGLLRRWRRARTRRALRCELARRRTQTIDLDETAGRIAPR